jgi:hypothetical protein
MTINTGNDEIYEITIDGTQVREVTVDGVIAWVEANFDIRNLSAPNEVTEGDNFTVSADVKNIGDGRDTQNISFNRGGSTSKTLEGAETTTVSFGETINNNGDFTLRISSGDDSESQTVTVLTPANFDVRNLSAPNTVTEGDNFNVSADVVNTGQTSDTQNISFNRGGSTNRSLSGNSSTNVSFGETINNTGNFNLSISSDDDSESRNITVESAIPDSVIAQDLVAWYRFEDGDARDYTATLDATFADSTAYDGTINGATFQSNGGVTDFENGANSGAYDFDDVNDVIQLPSSLTMGNRTQFTVCLWADLVNRGRIVVEDEGGSFNSNGTFEFIYSGGNGILYMVRDNSGNAVNTSVGPTSGLHHLAISFDNGKFDCYSDASVVASLDTGDSVANTGSDDIAIGASHTNNDNFGGKVDDVRFYNRALTASEISDIYNATKP